ncbi:MAG TPA: serine/threonine-protein kinase [Tahibacter sp.]|uniref:serine/threonine-protein kinase n=1 Tax=Tahibacter sp. TaxID=2056211 RepID=UPI002C5CAC07|nr:serine/threonine-protein kinase [Tahibacter sp.]HSX58698.1 serine/threonine-protein kinase [Tahibacter sp.]
MTDAARYRRAKDEYLRLSELDDDARERALLTLAGEDAALADSLRKLFDAAAQTMPALDAAREATPQIARYRLIREIGRGGMGRVWLAERDDGGFAGRVAIKQIDREAWSASDERRFVRERQILASLDHPNIARLIDGGTDGNGRPFLAIWYIDGLRVTQYCEQHALSVRARLSLLRRIGDAVAYAHRRLVVHRDIKPANILVDTDGEPRLLDFGIARMLDEDTAATATGASPLTLRYAAPEQIRGELAGIPADVHALGCLLYELLAGEPPHAEAGAAALTHAILHLDPPPPSQVARRRGRAAVSADLDAICLRALRKRPEDRYRSVDDWNADIDRAIAGEPVQARRGERGYAARRWLRRRWPWLAAAGVLVGIATYHVISINRQLAAVARERDRASELADFAITLYQSARPAEIRAGSVSALDLLDRTAARLDEPKMEKLKPEVRAALVASIGHVYYEIGVRDRAVQLFERAVGLFEQADPVPEDDLALHMRYAAMAQYDRNQAEAALAWIERALARRTRIGDDGSLLRSGLDRAAAIYAQSLDQLDRAAEHTARAIAVLEANLPDKQDELALALGNAATLDIQLGELDRAERRLARARELANRESTVYYRSDLFLRRTLAKVLFAKGRRDEGLTLLRDALADARRLMGAQHPDVLVFAVDYGGILTRAGRLDDAGAAFDEALAVGNASAGDSARQLIGVRAARARWLLARDQPADAAKELEAVLAERAKTPQRDRRSAAYERAALAYARCRLGEAEAPAALRTALTAPEAISVATRPGVADDFAQWRAACGF